MSKRFLSFLLSLSLLFSLVPSMGRGVVYAGAGSAGVTCTYMAAGGEAVTAGSIEWVMEVLDEEGATQASIRLEDDVVLEHEWYIGEDYEISLDLAGHQLSLSPESDECTIRNYGKLTIEDTVSGGMIAGNGVEGGDSLIHSNGDLVLNRVTLTGGKASYGGGAVYVDEGSFTMNGGRITGNTAEVCGGGLYISTDGTAVINGGRIDHNGAGSAEEEWGYGGGIYAYSSVTLVNTTLDNNMSGDYGGALYLTDNDELVVTLDGVTIKENEAAYGGGVYADYDSTLYVSGSAITGNKGTSGAGGIYNRGNLTVGGKARVSGNTCGAATENIYLNYSMMDLGDGAVVPVPDFAEPLGISAYTAGDYVPVTGFSAEDKLGYFISDNPLFTLANMDGAGETAVVLNMPSDTFLLKDGKAYLNDESCEYTTGAAMMGLSYDGDAQCWNMNRFSFVSTAADRPLLKFADGDAKICYKGVCEIYGLHLDEDQAVIEGANLVIGGAKGSRNTLMIVSRTTAPAVRFEALTVNGKLDTDYSAAESSSISLSSWGPAAVAGLQKPDAKATYYTYVGTYQELEAAWSSDLKTYVDGDGVALDRVALQESDPPVEEPKPRKKKATVEEDAVDGADATTDAAVTADMAAYMTADAAALTTANAGYKTCDHGDDCLGAAFSDLDADGWYHDGVHFVLEAGIMKGKGAGVFDPSGTLSRSQLVTMLWNLEAQPYVDYLMAFGDVDQNQWYGEAVRWAASCGIVSGFADGSFRPDAPITREETAMVLYNYAKAKGYDVSVGEDTNILSYDDAITEISSYAYPALQWACGAGVMSGYDNLLKPLGKTTRAEAAAMMLDFCEWVRGLED